jgi:hypothetical protein
MLARRPSRRPPPLSAPRGRLHAAYRLSAGFTPAAVARAEAVAEREVEALLARPDFQRLPDAVRALAALPEEERLARLEQMAWCTLELAMAEGDWRCAAFVLSERRLGRNPARTLARRVAKAQARAAALPGAPKPAESAPPPQAPPPNEPAGAAVRGAAVFLRDAVAIDAALAHEPAPQPAAAPAPPSPALPRRPDSGLAARLRGGTAAARPPEPDAASHRGLLHAWAQGP